MPDSCNIISGLRSELVPGEDGCSSGGGTVVHSGLSDQEVSRDDLLGGDGLAHTLGHLQPGVAALVPDVLQCQGQGEASLSLSTAFLPQFCPCRGCPQ